MCSALPHFGSRVWTVFKAWGVAADAFQARQSRSDRPLRSLLWLCSTIVRQQYAKKRSVTCQRQRLISIGWEVLPVPEWIMCVWAKMLLPLRRMGVLWVAARSGGV